MYSLSYNLHVRSENSQQHQQSQHHELILLTELVLHLSIVFVIIHTLLQLYGLDFARLIYPPY